MPSDIGFVEYVCEQVRDVPGVSYRKMFGEYALYVGEKVVALVCENQLFVKPTTAGRALLNTPREAPPYGGAKPYFAIGEHLEDQEFMAQLLTVTEGELPAPKPRKAKRRKPRT